MTLQEQLRRGETTSVKLVEDAIAKAKADTHNCFITITEERALAQAKRIDARRKAGDDVGILGGVPVALKDLINEEGVRTTCGSKILGDFVAPYDATVTRRLRDAGGISIGKLNMDEFAMGSSNENSAFGPVKNPRDPALVAGGSSGGSAAAVAADIVFGTLGSDTGGSIRTPAAFCGVVGIKPTYGRVSRFGVTAFASSLDQVGPLAKNVRDSALMLQAICGHDPRDSTSSDKPVPAFSFEGGAAGLRIGVLNGWEAGCSPDVTKAVSAALQTYQRLGAVLVDVTLPHTKFGISAYYMLATAEASSNLARYDGVRFGKRVEGQGLAGMYEATRHEGFGAEVKRRILLGTYVLSAGYYDAFYVKAQKARALIKQDFAQAFAGCDVIAMPTTPTTAFRIGEKIADPLAMYLTDVFTVNVNLAGLPALSLPCANNVGLQLIGKHWDEATLLRAAHALEVTQ